MNNKEKMFTNIIRDADKIDILYLYTLGDIKLEIDNEFSKEVYESLLNKKAIDRKELKNLTDRLSITLGFIFDTNYKESIEYLKNKKYFDTIIDIYKSKTNNEKLREQLEEIRKVINNYIEVSLC